VPDRFVFRVLADRLSSRRAILSRVGGQRVPGVAKIMDVNLSR